MKLFGDFDAVKFPEENLMFITHDRYLYYIYSFERKNWHRYQNAGNDMIHIDHYPDVSREELEAAMGGIFPKKETDFLRLCYPSELWPRGMMGLLSEDYPDYMSPYGSICSMVEIFLSESDLPRQSYKKTRELFEAAAAKHLDATELPDLIQKLSFDVLGRDIYARKIEIFDGHNSSSYFWIQPVRVIDYEDTDDMYNVAEMKGSEISIEEDDVAQYLTPFLYKYFDPDLDANKNRPDASDFEWNLTYNYYTHGSISCILRDIRAVIDALSTGKPCEAVDPDWMKELSADAALVIDFYKRFVYRMEYMMTIGAEKGYDLISFMGP